MSFAVLLVLALILAAAALWAVAYPILGKGRSAAPTTTSRSAAEELDDLLAQRDSVFTALRDLSFDHRVGKITDEDFVAFEAHLKGVAADALRAVDEWEAKADRALRAARQRPSVAAPTAPGGAARLCPSCGQPATPDDKFCAKCGAALPAPASNACPGCGRPFAQGDRFCAGCGHALAG